MRFATIVLSILFTLLPYWGHTADSAPVRPNQRQWDLARPKSNPQNDEVWTKDSLKLKIRKGLPLNDLKKSTDSRFGPGVSGGGGSREIKAVDFPEPEKLKEALLIARKSMQKIRGGAQWAEDLRSAFQAEIKDLHQNKKFLFIADQVFLGHSRFKGDYRKLVSVASFTWHEPGMPIYFSSEALESNAQELSAVVAHEVLHHVLAPDLSADEDYVTEFTRQLMSGGTLPVDAEVSPLLNLKLYKSDDLSDQTVGACRLPENLEREAGNSPAKLEKLLLQHMSLGTTWRTDARGGIIYETSHNERYSAFLCAAEMAARFKSKVGDGAVFEAKTRRLGHRRLEDRVEANSIDGIQKVCGPLRAYSEAEENLRFQLIGRVSQSEIWSQFPSSWVNLAYDPQELGMRSVFDGSADHPSAPNARMLNGLGIENAHQISASAYLHIGAISIKAYPTPELSCSQIINCMEDLIERDLIQPDENARRLLRDLDNIIRGYSPAYENQKVWQSNGPSFCGAHPAKLESLVLRWLHLRQHLR